MHFLLPYFGTDDKSSSNQDKVFNDILSFQCWAEGNGVKAGLGVEEEWQHGAGKLYEKQEYRYTYKRLIEQGDTNGNFPTA